MLEGDKCPKKMKKYMRIMGWMSIISGRVLYI